jgi:hypothetical protein
MYRANRWLDAPYELGASSPAASGDVQRTTLANACRAPMYQANRWLDAPYALDLPGILLRGSSSRYTISGNLPGA